MLGDKDFLDHMDDILGGLAEEDAKRLDNQPDLSPALQRVSEVKRVWDEIVPAGDLTPQHYVDALNYFTSMANVDRGETRFVRDPMVDGYPIPGLYRQVEVSAVSEAGGHIEKIIQVLKRGYLRSIVTPSGEVDWSEARILNTEHLQAGTEDSLSYPGGDVDSRFVTVAWSGIDPDYLHRVEASLIALDKTKFGSPEIQGVVIDTGLYPIKIMSEIARDGSGTLVVQCGRKEFALLLHDVYNTDGAWTVHKYWEVPRQDAQGIIDGYKALGGWSSSGSSYSPASGLVDLVFRKRDTSNAEIWTLHLNALSDSGCSFTTWAFGVSADEAENTYVIPEEPTNDIVRVQYPSADATVLETLEEHGFEEGDEIRVSGTNGLEAIEQRTYYVKPVTSSSDTQIEPTADYFIQLYTDHECTENVDSSPYPYTSGGTVQKINVGYRYSKDVRSGHDGSYDVEIRKVCSHQRGWEYYSLQHAFETKTTQRWTGQLEDSPYYAFGYAAGFELRVREERKDDGTTDFWLDKVVPTAVEDVVDRDVILENRSIEQNQDINQDDPLTLEESEVNKRKTFVSTKTKHSKFNNDTMVETFEETTNGGGALAEAFEDTIYGGSHKEDIPSIGKGGDVDVDTSEYETGKMTYTENEVGSHDWSGAKRKYNKQETVNSHSAITSITLASPAKVTSPGHGLSDGDQVLIYGVTSPEEVNGYHIVTSASTNTFALDGFDSSELDSYGGTGFFTAFSASANDWIPYAARSGAGFMKVVRNAPPSDFYEDLRQVFPGYYLINPGPTINDSGLYSYALRQEVIDGGNVGQGDSWLRTDHFAVDSGTLRRYFGSNGKHVHGFWKGGDNGGSSYIIIEMYRNTDRDNCVSFVNGDKLWGQTHLKNMIEKESEKIRGRGFDWWWKADGGSGASAPSPWSTAGLKEITDWPDRVERVANAGGYATGVTSAGSHFLGIRVLALYNKFDIPVKPAEGD